MTRFLPFILFTTAFLIVLFWPAANAQVWVLTDKNHAVSNVPSDTRITFMDQATDLENTLSQGLPASPEEAHKEARQRLTPHFHQKLRLAYQDIANVFSLGIKAVPAVVVDQQYVVYGISDVGKAVELIREHKRETGHE